MSAEEAHILSEMRRMAAERGLRLAGARVRRTSSRCCLGVEHGDYNGTELFGVGTDRFIWVAFLPNDSGVIRLYSDNFPEDGLISFRPGGIPPPRDPALANTWARFAYGVCHVLRAAGYPVSRGFDAMVHGNIPGGGMSRSASLCLNLILAVFDANGVTEQDGMRIVELAQRVENEYIGSPCGILDQVMIYFARAGMGTHFDPRTRKISYVPLGASAPDIRIVSLDTGTMRPGLEKSTYRVRRAECEELLSLAQNAGIEIGALADVQTPELYEKISSALRCSHPHLLRRLDYLYHAQLRFYELMDAWEAGNVERVGAIFRADGIGLRDDYQISGPELETMCDIARTVPGVLGERMLGGGDKGAAGAIVRAEAVEVLQKAVATAYPRSRPALADRYAVHACRIVQGIVTLEGAF